MIGYIARMTLAVAGLYLALGAGVAAPQAAAVSELKIVTAGGRHTFRVEMAADDETRTRGLMHRRTMAPDAGMLFDYGREQPVAMWMRNTFIPLDMLFIGANGTIRNIHERAIPHDLTAIPSDGPVRAVLELNGGTVSRLGIRAGDRIEHAIFKGSGR